MPKRGDHVVLAISARRAPKGPYSGTVAQIIKTTELEHAFYLQPDGLPEQSARLLCFWVWQYGDKGATWVLNAHGQLYTVDALKIT